MNTIHYFTHKDGTHFVAIAPEQYREAVTYSERKGRPDFAKIEFMAGTYLRTDYYEVIENGFTLCSRQTYLEVRSKAQVATAKFFGDSEEFTTPPTRPLYVDRPNCQHMVNDLPF